tara:strand:- start:383 stop:904 length:522 start_codon:yes stop_codon:yes gene_type:complete
VSSLTVQNIQGSASSSNTINVASGHVLNAPGHVVQIVQLSLPGNVGTSSSTVLQTTSASYVDFLTKAITTKLANSQIYIKTYSMYYSDQAYGDGRLLRDSTEIDACKYQYYTANANDFHSFGFQILDSPNAAAGTTITYKQQIKYNSGAALGLGYGDNGGKVNTNMTLMEIAQ